MNPSASGWLKKLLSKLPYSKSIETDMFAFYNKLKASGFIYGSNVSCVNDHLDSLDFNEEERCKINLVTTFYFLYQTENSKLDFISSVIDFYEAIDEHKSSFLFDFFGEPKPDILLEKIIHKRIHIDDNFISKNFSYFSINGLIFIDVIGYYHFLRNKKNVKTYLSFFEATIKNIVFKVFNHKSQKTEYDNKLIKLLEASLRYKRTIDIAKPIIQNPITEPLEKLYIIDALCMACWSDKSTNQKEFSDLKKFIKELNIDLKIFSTSLEHINTFYLKNRDKIAFLSSNNIAQIFYNNSASMVKRLIKRNSKRLIKELTQSKEALYLLTKSTHTQLSEEEQKKIQNQLLDIFKSIPSLAIFMLPGGMILLPLFVKFIPKLLPSAFDENRIEPKQ